MTETNTRNQSQDEDEHPLVENFADLELSEEMLTTLESMGYAKPTPVQGATIPLTLSGLDLIIQAQTGTGKTAAFAIPTVELLDNTDDFGALILAPTRELAKQVCVEFERLGANRNLNATAVYGGVGYGPQIEAMNKAQVIAATPGRLLDHLRSGKLSLSKLRLFILDEADEMLSMGFEKELDEIISYLPEKRQCLLFSATVNEHIKSLAGHFLHNPEYVSLSSDSVAAQSVQHYYFVVDGMQLVRDLVKLIEAYDPESALVFCNTRIATQSVQRQLERMGYPCDVINGDLPQKVREKALANVKGGRVRFLIATDVAARGIDISGLPFVINYNMPDGAESYIHRTGRTGRAGQKGTALTLLSPQQIGTLYQLKTLYKLELEEKVLPTREEIQQLRGTRVLEILETKLKKDPKARRYAPFLGVADRILEMDDARKIVARFVSFYDAILHEAEAERAAIAKEELRLELQAQAEQEAAEARGDDDRDRRPRSDRRDDRGRDDRGRDDRGRDDRSARDERSDQSAAPARDDNDGDHEAGDSDDEAPRKRRRRRRRRSPEGDETQSAESTTQSDDGRTDEETSKPSAPVAKKPADSDASRYATITVNVGGPGLDRKGVVELVCHLAGVFPDDLGKVRVEDGSSDVQVRVDYLDDVVNAIDGHQHETNQLRVRVAD